MRTLGLAVPGCWFERQMSSIPIRSTLYFANSNNSSFNSEHPPGMYQARPLHPVRVRDDWRAPGRRRGTRGAPPLRRRPATIGPTQGDLG